MGYLACQSIVTKLSWETKIYGATDISNTYAFRGEKKTKLKYMYNSRT